MRARIILSVVPCVIGNPQQVRRGESPGRGSLLFGYRTGFRKVFRQRRTAVRRPALRRQCQASRVRHPRSQQRNGKRKITMLFRNTCAVKGSVASPKKVTAGTGGKQVEDYTPFKTLGRWKI